MGILVVPDRAAVDDPALTRTVPHLTGEPIEDGQVVSWTARRPPGSAPAIQPVRTYPLPNGPPLDNYEGMTVIVGPGPAGVSLISDDNFSATQFTRVPNLVVRLP